MPSKPATPYSYRDGANIVLAWVKPRTNGLEITSYNIWIQAKDGSFLTQLMHCDGSDPAVVAGVSCEVPLTTLIAAPFSLVQEDQVYLKITASNAYGESLESSVGSGATIKLVPDAPLMLTEDASITLQDRVGLTWTDGAQDGGTQIIDY